PVGARPGPDEYGSVLEQRDLGAAAVRLVVSGGLGDRPADPELRAEDPLGPDDRLLVAACAGVSEAPQGADHDDVVVGEHFGAGVDATQHDDGAVRLDAAAAPDRPRDDHGLAPRLKLAGRWSDVRERATRLTHAPRHGLDDLEGRAVGHLEGDLLLDQ